MARFSGGGSVKPVTPEAIAAQAAFIKSSYQVDLTVEDYRAREEGPEDGE